MDIIILAILLATGTFLLNAKEQRKRIALLGSHLANYQIEKLMAEYYEIDLKKLAAEKDDMLARIREHQYDELKYDEA